MRLLAAVAAALAAAASAAEPPLWRKAALSMCEMEPRRGAVEDCRCDFAVVDAATEATFGPLLSDLTSRRFFRYFKVALDRACPYWPDDGTCGRESCAVRECASEEVPAPWLEEERNRTQWLQQDAWAEPAFLCEASGDPLTEAKGAVDRASSDSDSWSESGGDEVWIEQGDDEGMIYVDLLANPEGYTGYDGELARRVWRAIYEENCFDLRTPAPPKEQLLMGWRQHAEVRGEPTGQCLERRVFYKLVSGLQASISTHIAASPFSLWEIVSLAPASLARKGAAALGALASTYIGGSPFLANATSNDALFLERVGRHEDRLHNLYFAYLFTLRAVAVAGEELASYEFDTGDASDDLLTRKGVRALVASQETLLEPEDGDTCAAASAARAAFDESLLFRAPDDERMSPLERALARESVEELRAQFVQRFRNVSTIMDCVTCEKCRLWGKLQVLGLGTALKILLMQGDAAGVGSLQRNEVVALVNTLAQLAKSVDSIRDWQKRDVAKAYAHFVVAAGVSVLVLLLVLCRLLRRGRG